MPKRRRKSGSHSKSSIHIGAIKGNVVLSQNQSGGNTTHTATQTKASSESTEEKKIGLTTAKIFWWTAVIGILTAIITALSGVGYIGGDKTRKDTGRTETTTIRDASAISSDQQGGVRAQNIQASGLGAVAVDQSQNKTINNNTYNITYAAGLSTFESKIKNELLADFPLGYELFELTETKIVFPKSSEMKTNAVSVDWAKVSYSIDPGGENIALTLPQLFLHDERGIRIQPGNTIYLSNKVNTVSQGGIAMGIGRDMYSVKAKIYQVSEKGTILAFGIVRDDEFFKRRKLLEEQRREAMARKLP